MLKSVVKSIIFVISGLMLSNTCVYSQTEQITINKSDTVIDGNGGLLMEVSSPIWSLARPKPHRDGCKPKM